MHKASNTSKRKRQAIRTDDKDDHDNADNVKDDAMKLPLKLVHADDGGVKVIEVTDVTKDKDVSSLYAHGDPSQRYGYLCAVNQDIDKLRETFRFKQAMGCGAYGIILRAISLKDQPIIGLHKDTPVAIKYTKDDKNEVDVLLRLKLYHANIMDMHKRADNTQIIPYVYAAVKDCPVNNVIMLRIFSSVGDRCSVNMKPLIDEYKVCATSDMPMCMIVMQPMKCDLGHFFTEINNEYNDQTITIERVSRYVDEALNQILRILYILHHKCNIVHNDPHIGNFLVDWEGDTPFFTAKKTDKPEVEKEKEKETETKTELEAQNDKNDRKFHVCITDFAESETLPDFAEVRLVMSLQEYKKMALMFTMFAEELSETCATHNKVNIISPVLNEFVMFVDSEIGDAIYFQRDLYGPLQCSISVGSDVEANGDTDVDIIIVNHENHYWK